jgi:hypothetical protein
MQGNIVPFTPSVPTEIPDHLLHKLAKFTVPELRNLCKKYKVRHAGNKLDLLLELYCLCNSRFTDEDFESKGTGKLPEEGWLEKLKQRRAERLKEVDRDSLGKLTYNELVKFLTTCIKSGAIKKLDLISLALHIDPPITKKQLDEATRVHIPLLKRLTKMLQ